MKYELKEEGFITSSKVVRMTLVLRGCQYPWWDFGICGVNGSGLFNGMGPV